MEKLISILIVNTDPVEISLIRTIFEKSLENTELLEAHTRSQAKDILTTNDIDCVLADIDLGDSCGQDIAGDLRELELDIPVIILTNVSTRDATVDAVELGVAHSIAKSLKQLKKLPAKIAGLIERQESRKTLEYLQRTNDGIRLSSFLESSPFGVVIIDEAGLILQVNPVVINILCYEVDDLIGSKLTGYCKKSEISEIKRSISRLFRGEIKNLQVECQFRHKSGHYLWFDVSASLVRNNYSEPMHCILQFKDIAERKSADLQLSRQSSLNGLLGNIAVAANDAPTFDDALEVCLDEVCDFTGWPLGHAYMVEENFRKYDVRKYRFPADSDFEQYQAVSGSIRKNAAAGLPGRVMLTKRPTWISDFSDAEEYMNAEYLTEYGLKAGFAFPIFGRNDVVTILEFFCSEVTEPDFEFLDVMAHIGIQLGHVYERERTRKSLQLSEEKFATAFRSSPDAISIVTIEDRKFIEINEQFLQLFEYRRHEVIGKRTDDLFIWHDPDQEQVLFGELRKFGKVHNMEADLCNAIGIVLNCLISAELITINGIDHVLVLTRDITEKVKTTAALKRSEGLLRSYFNAGFVGMAIISPDNKFIQVNDTVRDIFGYAHEQLLGRGINDFTVPEDIVESNRLFNSVITGEIDGYSEEKRCLRKDGSIVSISMLTESVRKDDGTIDYLVAFFRDITKRKLSENELRKSEARLRKAQHIAHLGFWEIDMISDELFFSDEIFSICGIDRQQFDNSRLFFSKMIHPQDYERVKQERKKSIRTGIPFNTEYRIIRTDGEVRYVHSQGEVISDDSNKAIRMVGTLQDITDRKISEIALYKSNRALRVLSESTHTIVHATSGQEMIDAVCNTIVETGGYRFAWVGYARSDEAKTVYPVAKAGYEAGYLDNYFSWSREAKRFDPVSDAISTGNISLVKNLTEDDVYGSVRNAALERGYRSEIALPLNAGNKAFGALMIYASEPDAFDDEEILLLTSLADDLAFGILSLHSRAEYERSGHLLKGTEDNYRFLHDEHPAIIFMLDKDGVILTVNRYGANQLGYSVNELVGSSIIELSYNSFRRAAEKNLKTWMEKPGEVQKWEQQMVCKDGSLLWVDETVKVITDMEGEQYIYIICEDISENRKQSDQLTYKATHDSLTGLINRSEFEDRLNNLLLSVMVDNSQHALCYMDIEQFRMINDTCGHVAGDELLRQLGALLLGLIRTRDTVARLGGDEFVILMEHCPLYQAETIARKIIKAVEDFRFVWDRKTFRLSASLGLVPVNNLSGNIAEILNNADQACYTARDMGPNRLHIYGVSDAAMVKKHGEIRRLGEIREALANEGFELCFQAIESLKARKDEICRFEVLLRMKDGAGTLRGADEFMPVAERYNLSVDIDKWVIDKLFDLTGNFQKHDSNIPQFFVNLSGHSLGDSGLLEFVLQKINSLTIPPEKICFEITETVAIANLTHATRFINILRETGCYFALDDFGSGLSSYTYLKNLHVDYLKIDGYFIQNIADDPVNIAIVKSMHEIGKTLGKQTIAEFVENKKTCEILRQIGLDYVQGNYVAEERTFDDIRRNNLANIIEFSKRS